jgi:hypothetical protein
MTEKRTDRSITDIWARFTACLERQAGEWMIVHAIGAGRARRQGVDRGSTRPGICIGGL